MVAASPRKTSTLGLTVSSTRAHAEKHTNTQCGQRRRTPCDLSPRRRHLIPVLPLDFNLIKNWIVFGRRAELVPPRANRAGRRKKRLLSCPHGIVFYLPLPTATDSDHKNRRLGPERGSSPGSGRECRGRGGSSQCDTGLAAHSEHRAPPDRHAGGGGSSSHGDKDGTRRHKKSIFRVQSALERL